ncbi:MAG: hypothetical protein KF780_09245 [Sphingomonas sp.]|nr:hypothetical protein [Sphingomonas sp.]
MSDSREDEDDAWTGGPARVIAVVRWQSTPVPGGKVNKVGAGYATRFADLGRVGFAGDEAAGAAKAGESARAMQELSGGHSRYLKQ